MFIYNTLTAKKEEFVPLKDNLVQMYVCGPTVYDKGHLGHGRSMVAFDVVRRYLLYKGYEVNFVTNYTDIDDKMINRAAEEGVSVQELATRISALYDRDFAALAIMKPSARPLVTEHIPRTMDLVRQLLANGTAYELSDGVYFDVTKFPAYGNLSKQNLSELQEGARVAVIEDKRNPQDFVLWKHKKTGEPSWQDPEGVLQEGRPGWHIECSAMTADAFGEQMDIHGGGADLMFPHHECEIAQSEACFGKQMAKYWMHNGFVRIDGEKMSKSLNNFKTLEAIFANYDPLVVRYALLSHHYRGPIDFTDKLLTQAAASLQRLRDFVERLTRFVENEVKNLQVPKRDYSFAESLTAGFVEGMDNDFDISQALAAIFTMITEVNKAIDADQFSQAEARDVLDALRGVDSVLACLFVSEVVPESVLELVKMREMAREAKDYQLADSLRDQIQQAGYVVEDANEGAIVKKIVA